jgi:hypothetical protein
MSLDTAINILMTVTLIEMMVLIGLEVTFAEIVNAARTCPMIARAAAEAPASERATSTPCRWISA